METAFHSSGYKQTTGFHGIVGLNSGTHLSALTGVRFFAVFHIFLFHLWVLYDVDLGPQLENIMIGFADLPAGMVTFLSHGWISTSFFFLLSGFILAYLYWGEDGRLVISKKQFWLTRFTRIYPIYILLLLTGITLMLGYVLSQGHSVKFVVASIFANVTLMQAWYPPFVPVWNWPAWTISALVFLYFMTPYLMRWFSCLSCKQMKATLCVLPFISLFPVVVYAWFFPAGADPGQNWRIFIGSMPVFWLPHFIAGMLLSRAFKISRFNPGWRPTKSRRISWGDAALLVVVVIACIPVIEEEPLKYFFRQGLLMPLFMVAILDMARNHGIVARLFSLPGTGFLGETGYSIFIWQNLVMWFCGVSLLITLAAGQYHLWVVPVVMVLIAIFSTYVIEKPVSRWIRRKYRD